MSIHLHHVKLVTILFVLAVAVNYPWELAQRPLYAGAVGLGAALWHCLIAALGDGLLVVLIFAAAAAAQGSIKWFVRPTAGAYAAMFGAALVVGFAVEWWGVRVAQRWQYSERMPVISGIDIGIVPLVQMLLLPPLVFWILRRSLAGGYEPSEERHRGGRARK